MKADMETVTLDASSDIAGTSNPYELRQRSLKVARLVLLLERAARGALGPGEWELVASLAGVNPPSPTTQAQVQATLVARARRAS